MFLKICENHVHTKIYMPVQKFFEEDFFDPIVYVVYTLCLYYVYVMYMLCICYVYVMYMLCICYVYVMYMLCICYVYLCICYVYVIYLSSSEL